MLEVLKLPNYRYLFMKLQNFSKRDVWINILVYLFPVQASFSLATRILLVLVVVDLATFK